MKYVHKTCIQKHTFLKGGEQRELFDEARLDEGRFDADSGNDGGEHEEVVAELSVVVTVALRQLLYEGVTQLADARKIVQLYGHFLAAAVVEQVPQDVDRAEEHLSARIVVHQARTKPLGTVRSQHAVAV